MDSDAIYNYTGKIATVKRRLEQFEDSRTVIEFLDALKDHGLSKGRVSYYAARLPRIMEVLEKHSVRLNNASKDDCKKCVREITDDRYAGKTNRAFSEIFKRLVHFAKTGKIGRKKNGEDYVDEVAWIVPEIYIKTGRKKEIKPGDLLTYDEFEMFVDGVARVSKYGVRDRAMAMCMYEGAFRPGELLQMTIGGVVFKDKIAVITTTGKTGEKTVPLLLSYKPLLEWIEQHPLKENLDAPVWWSFKTNKVVGYAYLQNLVKEAGREAGIKKKVWNYLLRHTKLTDVAKKHPDQILKKFGNWHGSTKMMEVYIHLSTSDLENAVLKEHGLVKEEDERKLTLKSCPRCSEQNTIGAKRCVRCGLILDEKLAIKAAHRESETLRSLVKRIEKLEGLDKKVDRIFEELLSKRTEKSSQH